MTFCVTIVGRENVGKSTLFNKLAKEKSSIVLNKPGVTRDYLKRKCQLFDIEFDIIDTAGWHLRKTSFSFNQIIKKNVIAAIEEADVILFIIDGQSQICDEDLVLAQLVRKSKKRVILAANKSDKDNKLSTQEIGSLGLGQCLHISAEHKLGFEEIYNKLNEYIPSETNQIIPEEVKKNLSIAIIGRPNVGKSTLFNRILEQERSLVSDLAGTTRDSVDHEVSILGQDITLIDTAGARRKNKIKDNIEGLSIKQTIAAIREAKITIQVMDAENIFEKQDLRISNLALENKSLFILVINKSDLIKNMKDFDDELQYLINKKLSQINDVKVIYTSFKNKFNRDEFFRPILDLWQKYDTRISTRELNDWLEDFLTKQNLPIVKGNTRLKIKYIKQSGSKPPSFTLFINISGKYQINSNLHKFLLNALKESFDLKAIPIKINFKTSSNPYSKS